MFDLTTGKIDRPFRETHGVATVFSVAAHIVAVGGFATAVFLAATDQLPQVPTVLAFVAEVHPPAPPPPPPPPPSATRARNQTQPAKPAPTDAPTFTAPTEIPTGIQPESALVDLGDEGGVPGGVPGGIPGGVIGGIPGGIAMGPPPPPPQKPRRVGGNIKAPALVHRVEPDYPPIAVSAKVAGVVILEATVDDTGRVTHIDVLRSIPLLDRAATKAVAQWRYAPLILNESPTPFIVVVTLTFSLR
jgi:protein TonB